MEAGPSVEEDLVFRGVEFSMKVEMENGLLVVELSDVKTADQWRGEFDPAYIEDLTRKTGNFKQFPIFCSMLESAVRKGSDSVTLDLLTYADLELLRNRKAGVVGRPRGGQQSPALGAKRYLILIYTVEFDRIHYPLPLPYKGQPDPAALLREIRALRTRLGTPGHAHTETQRLRAELAQVREENQALVRVLEQLQTGRGKEEAAWRSREALRVLEEQLVEEQGKRQRSASKRSQEQHLLVEQLEELRASESALRVRVKSLTSELSFLRRGATPLSSRGDNQTYRSLSRERNPTSRERTSLSRDRTSTSRERTSLSRDRGSGGTGLHGRSGSRERADRGVPRSGQRGLRADSSGPCRPSPSPLGSRGPRFDPTAYIQDRQRRLKEADLKKLRKTRRDMMASPVLSERGRSRSREPRLLAERGSSRGRSLSTEGRGGRPPSAGSLVDEDHMTSVLLRGRKPTSTGQMKSRGNGTLGRKPLCSTPTYRRGDQERSIDGGTELSEIDARLQALQDYMRDLDTGP